VEHAEVPPAFDKTGLDANGLLVKTKSFVGLIGFASGVGLLDERVEAGCAGAVRTAGLRRGSAFCL